MKRRPRVFSIRSEIYPFFVVFLVGPRPCDRDVGSICRKYGLWNGEGRPPTAGTYLAECASGKRKEKEFAPTIRGWWQD